ncbi:MAG: Cys-tRNA(Pro) deacylase [Desulfocapsaceae bacterium]|jgi:Cys-tRNA(Pro)/Cys-tRNA(Cys) deacylase|nr:Cys-tRNA(Pro) deacylase [Desulfocapsaceae bacterium]
MTPAVNILKKKKIAYTLHRYHHDQSAHSYGLEAAQKLDLHPERVFKTLVASLDTGELVVAIVPVTSMLNLKLLARACTSKKCAMAEKTLVEKTTGYVLGGISPLGQKKQLRTIIDSSAKLFKTMYISAGRRGLEIEMNPLDLVHLTRGSFAAIMEDSSS